MSIDMDQFLNGKRFDYKNIEPKIIEFWNQERIYEFNLDNIKKAILIDTPPPYANGALHHGHGMSYTQLDIIARYYRQRRPTLLPLAFDDNGLPTERFTEEKYGIEPGEHPPNFFDLCRNEAEKSVETQINQFNKIGFSYNHKISYTTIDDRSIRLTQKNFLDLLEREMITMEAEPQLWCPHCRTALAQADLESEDENTQLHYIQFPSSTTDDIIIVTSRPELIPAAVAIFYHPDDRISEKLSNSSEISNPWNDELLEIIADESIDPEFGTGIMMCSTFGDQNDIDLYRQYNLPMKIIIGEDGKMNDDAGILTGLSIKDARKKIISYLKEKGYWIRSEDTTHSIPICERCKTPIEIINSDQWKLDIMSYKEDLKRFANQINWKPDHMKKRLINWIDGLKWNWIISRQRFFGIPIPIWSCKKCEIHYPAKIDNLPIYPGDKTTRKCDNCDSNLHLTEEIFDTWFTSSLTPKILEDIYFNGNLNRPLDIRFQAHEIIRTWAFYTVTKSYLEDGEIPWLNALISGWGLGFKNKGKKGIKASKSSGTGKDPIELIEKNGADSFRYWAAQARLGKDQYLYEAILNRGRKLTTKIYNAAKIIHILISSDSSDSNTTKDFGQELKNEIDSIESKYHSFMSEFNFTDALQLIEDTFWNSFCSEWIEQYKLYRDNPGFSETDKLDLKTSLIRYLRMFAPFLPFITEYLNMVFWQSFGSGGYESIHIKTS